MEDPSRIKSTRIHKKKPEHEEKNMGPGLMFWKAVPQLFNASVL
jgi:hypothetical protein